MIGHHTGPNFTLPISAPLAILLGVVFVAVYLRLVFYFLEDLYQPERHVSGGNKDIWALIIVFGSVAGIVAYLLVGREN